MPDRTEHPSSTNPRGPWPEAGDGRIFDYGVPWCVNAAGHPGPIDDYPNPARHVPSTECRTRSLYVDALDGLSGPACDVEVYAAQPYRFGEPRERDADPGARVVFDWYNQATDAEGRLTMTLGDALRLA